MSVPQTSEDFKDLLAHRWKYPTPRGRDVRKMMKPYSCREVVFTCSNGWTIESLPVADFHIEGYFMGHCLGGPDGPRHGAYCSLREPDGTPHVTLSSGGNSLYGRCNAAPKPEYVTLINEYRASIGYAPLKTAQINTAWGLDADDAYHEHGRLSDRDYRDHPQAQFWRGKDWREKRNKGA